MQKMRSYFHNIQHQSVPKNILNVKLKIFVSGKQMIYANVYANPDQVFAIRTYVSEFL